MRSIAIVRGSDVGKVRTCLRDLIVFAGLTFETNARILDPACADDVLVRVMQRALTDKCDAAAAAPLLEDAGVAIGRTKHIHPPCHVIIVGPRYEEVYNELKERLISLKPIVLDLDNSEDIGGLERRC